MLKNRYKLKYEKTSKKKNSRFKIRKTSSVAHCILEYLDQGCQTQGDSRAAWNSKKLKKVKKITVKFSAKN